jgi:hypothetical protein
MIVRHRNFRTVSHFQIKAHSRCITHTLSLSLTAENWFGLSLSLFILPAHLQLCGQRSLSFREAADCPVTSAIQKNLFVYLLFTTFSTLDGSFKLRKGPTYYVNYASEVYTNKQNLQFFSFSVADLGVCDTNEGFSLLFA